MIYLFASGCAAPAPAVPSEPTDLAFVNAGLPSAAPREKVQEPTQGPAGQAVCRDDLGGTLARESCDRERILVAENIAFHPSRPAPPGKEREALAAVAALLRSRREILLVRIEVYSSRELPHIEARREELLQAQLRADAIFNFLWRHEKISAERLEAVGYAYDERKSRADASRWPVVLRIVQRGR